MKIIKANHEMTGIAYMVPDIVYSAPNGKELKLQLLKPWQPENPGAEKKYWPLIVFVQGSGYRFPDVYRKIPQLSEFARAGYVVASVQHRSSLEGNPFPAFLKDVKTAVRFLRAHAEEYDIDPDRVGIWGSSSGGATALMVGMTPGEPCYETGEYAGISDAVSAVCDCFGPKDLSNQVTHAANGEDFPYSESIKGLIGNATPERVEEMKALSPIWHLREGKHLPPTLVLHGDQDPTVAYSQSITFVEEAAANGFDCQMVCVEGAPHERGFWSQEVLNEIHAFFDKNLKGL